MFDYDFDKDRGFIQIVKDNLIFIPYTLLKIDSLAQFIRETIDPDFELILKRITGKNSQQAVFKDSIRFDSKELEEIHSSKFCQYFYTNKQIKSFNKLN